MVPCHIYNTHICNQTVVITLIIPLPTLSLPKDTFLVSELYIFTLYNHIFAHTGHGLRSHLGVSSSEVRGQDHTCHITFIFCKHVELMIRDIKVSKSMEYLHLLAMKRHICSHATVMAPRVLMPDVHCNFSNNNTCVVLLPLHF